MIKPALCKNKGANQLCSNCAADQRLCFHYIDSTIPLFKKMVISSFQPYSVVVQPSRDLTVNPKDRFSCNAIPMYYRNDPMFLDKQFWANSADPDQTAPREAV